MGFPRYAFDLRFDEPEGWPGPDAPAPEPEPAPDPQEMPRHTEAELAAAVAKAELAAFADGYQRGRSEGEEAASGRAEARLGELLEHLGLRLAELAEETGRIDRAREAEGAAILATLVRRLAPRLLEQQAETAMADLAAEALRVAGRQPEITIRVNPEFVEPLRQRLASRAQGASPRVDVLPDVRLAPGAVQADWGTGALSYDPAEIERAISALADRACLAPADPHQTRL